MAKGQVMGNVKDKKRAAEILLALEEALPDEWRIRVARKHIKVDKMPPIQYNPGEGDAEEVRTVGGS